MREAARKNKRRAFQRNSHLRLQQTRDLVGIVWMKRRQLGLLNGRQTDDNDRFGFVEGGRRVKPQTERRTLREAESGNVLVLRCAQQYVEGVAYEDGAWTQHPSGTTDGDRSLQIEPVNWRAGRTPHPHPISMARLPTVWWFIDSVFIYSVYECLTTDIKITGRAGLVPITLVESL